MKHISKIIKGFLCIALFVGLFSLNVASIQKSGHASENQSTITSYFGNRALAQTLVIDNSLASPSNADVSAGIDTTLALTNPGNPTSATSGGALSPGTLSDPTSTAATEKPGTSTDPKLILETVAKASTYVNKIFNPIIHYITFKIGAFLSNDYIFAGTMGEMLHNIWVINRNIVNIVFVLILLYLALKHIFKGEDSDIAKTLPKFVIMLIAINFSWLAGRLVLDAANVATNVVFAIPSGIQNVASESLDAMLAKTPCTVNEPKNGDVSAGCIPVPEHTFLPLDYEKVNNYLEPNCTAEEIKKLTANYDEAYGKDPKENVASKTASICWQQINLSDYNQNNASYYLSYSMARVQSLTRNTVGSITQTAVGTLTSLMLQVAYLVGFLTLFFVLIIRSAAMWLLMAFSPFIIMLMYLEMISVKPELGKAGTFLSVKGFTKWAFVPAKVAAVWAVGFIMITAGQSMDWTTVEKVGAHIYGADTLFMGMDSIQQFIWFLMSIGVVWVGTFSVFSDLEVAGGITNMAKGFVESQGKKVGMGVANKIPLFPVYDAKGQRKNFSLGDAISGTIKEMRGTYSPGASGGIQGEISKKLVSLKQDDFDQMTSAKSKDEILDIINKRTGLPTTQITNNSTEFQNFINVQASIKDENKKKIIDTFFAKPTSPELSAQPPAGG